MTGGQLGMVPVWAMRFWRRILREEPYRPLGCLEVGRRCRLLE